MFAMNQDRESERESAVQQADTTFPIFLEGESLISSQSLERPLHFPRFTHESSCLSR